MKPSDTGRQYDRISSWWDKQQNQLTVGRQFVEIAIRLAARKVKALDVGCGSGGRIVAALREAGFHITGIDVSEAMLEYARRAHGDSCFLLADICDWEIPEPFDAIIARDSIFHVPYVEQSRVVAKLCEGLASGGVILFTAGGIDGEITGPMCGQDFYYSSLEDVEYLRIMKENGCRCVLMERDQYPEEHVVFIAIKR